MKEAAISIIFFDQKVLLVKRRDVPVWVLPGGGIDDGETPENACLREAKEETGLSVTLVRKVGTWLPINRLASPAHVFECSLNVVPEELFAQEESKEVCFFPLDALPYAFIPLHHSWVKTALKNDHTRIYLMTELTYWNAIKTIIMHPIISIRYILSRMGLPLNN